MGGRMITLFPVDMWLTAHVEGLLLWARVSARMAGFLLICRGRRGGAVWVCPKGLHPKGYQDFVAFALGEFGSHVKVPSSLSTHLQATLNCVAFCEFVPELYYFNVAVSV